MLKNVARHLLRIVGILCLLYGAILLYYMRPAVMVLVWFPMGAVLIVLSIKALFNAVFALKPIRILAYIAVAAVVILEGLIIANGAAPAPAEPYDYLIVLGGTVNGETPSDTLRYRLDKTYDYMAAHPQTKAVLSGSQCENEAISEAEAMYRDLASKGIDKTRLIKEDQSHDTYENMRNSLELLPDKNLKLCVVSSDFHILRAKMLAIKQGRQVGGLGSQTFLPLIPYFHLREMLAIGKDLVIH